MSVAERHVTVPVTLRLDVLALVFGRAEVSSTEARLFALLASRASRASRLYEAVKS